MRLPRRPQASLVRYSPFSEESCAGGGAVGVTTLLCPPMEAVGLHPIVCTGATGLAPHRLLQGLGPHLWLPTAASLPSLTEHTAFVAFPHHLFIHEAFKETSMAGRAMKHAAEAQRLSPVVFRNGSRLAGLGTLAIEAVLEDTLKPIR
ncbi:hypothetical protein llap_21578 [Limosa lapponica baueri]|uniref:Uncharacterized protein n=1 Tax=Limosa lapponica baueri TaxID=1758121 RepID=A0A2I0T2U5_LIMLA|nr:hypothetical protein llap_21578 [Limosa lapponica baueri]